VCTDLAQKQFVRSHLDETYLWYKEIPRLDINQYLLAGEYFNALVLPAPKDRFSAVVPNVDANYLETGANFGFGVQWARDASGRLRVAGVIPDSPAAQAKMARGGEMVQVRLSNTDNWYPNAANAFVSFDYRDSPSATTSRTITLRTADIKEPAVPLTKTLTSPAGRKVGYIQFDAHTYGAQDQLISAVQQLKADAISELVLDLRYNAGGFLYIAHSLASMIAPTSTDGKVFERLIFNDKLNAVADAAPYTFSGSVQYGEEKYPANTPLPRLALKRLYVLTGPYTCSASEAIVNGLRGVDVEVVLIGSTTCGKPYGFSRRDNCGLSYYPIQFQGVNAKSFGDYTAGFVPNCTATDDLEHALGATNEGLLASALNHMDKGVCRETAQNLIANRDVPQGLSMSSASAGVHSLDNPQRHLVGKILRNK
jgi:hypothetical protein